MSRRKSRHDRTDEPTIDDAPAVQVAQKALTVADFVASGFEVRAKNKDRFQLSTDVARFVRDTSELENHLTMFVRDADGNVVFLVKRRVQA